MTRVTLATLTAALALCAAPAYATTYSNSASGSDLQPFGFPDSTGNGEIFTFTSEQILQDWTFFAASGDAGNLDLEIAKWNSDTLMATGSPLYSSLPFAYTGGSSPLSFSGINTELPAGTYIAYMTVATPGGLSRDYLSDPAASLAISTSYDTGGIGAGNAVCNSGGMDPIYNMCIFGPGQNSPSLWLYDGTGFNLQFVADVAEPSSSVAEPSTLGLLGACLIVLCLARRSRHGAGLTAPGRT